MLEFTKFAQTPIDEDEKLGLIPSLNSLTELNVWEQENIIEGRQWALNSAVLKRNDIFDVAFIIKLHKKMFDKTWAWAGEFRKTNKNIGIVKKYQPTAKIAWDAHNLFTEEQLRKKYILALQAADKTDYSLLFKLFL